MSRPSDFADADFEATNSPVRGPRLNGLEWLRWAWRQLTSMRTALLLLLALAVAAVPGSLIPQEGADPNGVIQWKASNAAWVDLANALQLFDVYTSVWFSAIYLLLFVSLIGCVIPRVTHHVGALRAAPPRTPVRLERLPSFQRVEHVGSADAALDAAERLLKRKRYRVARYGASVSAERGYLRETGNLLFHIALVGILIAVFVGGGLTYTGQRLLSVGDSFASTDGNWDSVDYGRFVDPTSLPLYSVTLDRFDVDYTLLGEAVNYAATVTTRIGANGPLRRQTLKVNYPLELAGTSVFLLGNGYSPHITIRNASGRVIQSSDVPFQPQNATLTSVGVLKDFDRPAGKDLGFIGFFYPTAQRGQNGAYTSAYPYLGNPLLTLEVWQGDLHPDSVQNVYSLDTSGLTELAGPSVGGAHPQSASLELKPGQTKALPDGAGTVTFDRPDRFVSLDIHHDPSQGWVAFFVSLAVAGLITSLLVPRRRMWVKVREDGDHLVLQYAALARGDDPGLERAVADLADEHGRALGESPPVKEPVGV